MIDKYVWFRFTFAYSELVVLFKVRFAFKYCVGWLGGAWCCARFTSLASTYSEDAVGAEVCSNESRATFCISSYFGSFGVFCRCELG